MRVPEIPVTDVFFSRDGKPTLVGILLIKAVNGLTGRTGGIDGLALGPLPSYTVAQLTVSATSGYLDPAFYARHMVYVSNGTSNKRLAISDGTDWRFPDGNVVS